MTADAKHAHSVNGRRDTWIFNIEAVATLCIALWFVWQQYAVHGVIPHTPFQAWAAPWWIPLFLAVFYCGAGYLYQKYQQVHSWRDMGRYMKREVIVLLTPYVFFGICTLAANSASGLEPGLTLANAAHALLVRPVGPVGYFIVLGVIYIITRTVRADRAMTALIGTAAAFKAAIVVVQMATPDLYGDLPYLVQQVPAQWIWFVLGMAGARWDIGARFARPRAPLAASAVFLCIVAAAFAAGISGPWLDAVIIFAGLAALFAVSAWRFFGGRSNAFFRFITRYTMAIWLMHAIFGDLALAALSALGLAQPLFVAAALPIVCYIIPVAVMFVLSKVWKLGFVVYPSRYLPPA